MQLTIIRTAMLTAALIAAPHVSADFESGQSAWDAGNVEEAVSQWRDAANSGDRRAMLELGRLYRQGLGVVQDYVEAHKWLNLAASRGEAAALEERDALAAQMTPDQIATAQQKAADWQPGGATQAEETSPAQETGQPPPQAIRAAQSLLEALGYQPGPADGVWGQGTKAAYQAFLRDMGMPQTDTLTPQSLRALQAAAEQQGIAPNGDEKTTDGTTQTPAPPAANTPPPLSPDALHNAAQAGDIEILKAAIATGVDVNARDSRGRTALMHAVDKGYLLLVSELLEALADVNVRALDGATALFMAAAHGHTEIIELLMKAGADVSIRGPQGKTPVDVARARYGEVSTARETGEPQAVLVLLDGKTWAQQAELERKRQEAEAKLRQLGIDMVSIPAGIFRMGDLSGEGWDDEQPVHSVTLSAFRLGKYEVTFAQWDACVADGGCNGYTPDDHGRGRSNRPVMDVSWDDVQSFIDWLNGKTRGKFRLPSEAEWEYAARAGTTTKYSWGDDIGSNRANCDNDNCGDSWDYTAPVGSFPANAWGLHDMHGNVYEWVQDCWNDNYEGAPTDGSAWTSGDCGRRVVRGGSWNDSAWNLRSAYRNRGARADRSHNLGFRLAQDE
ncbi:MAG: SUMF1/EgtB/PvdO family nonheme iron enzyme [Caldilineaceae bacterium]|nr:SUMF1/EgtB/PvdO family nonheme iron enzyme [Caldilineaceae bacterium]